MPCLGLNLGVAAPGARGASGPSNPPAFYVSTWTSQQASESGIWNSVIWADALGLFIAVSTSGGHMMTSPDGVVWTAGVGDGSGFEGQQWQGICWSPELHLAVAVGGTGDLRVMTTPDGITWTPRTSAEQNYWRAVCWAAELALFVAVAQDGTNRVMTSPDGITWSSASAVEAAPWLAIAWSAERGLLVALNGEGTAKIMTSPDGVNWTARTQPNENYWDGICWAKELGLFVAVAAQHEMSVMTSPDGITWTERQAAEPNNWHKVRWVRELGLLVAVSGELRSDLDNVAINRVMYSPDGTTWTAAAAAKQYSWNDLAWSPALKLFAAVGSQDAVTDLVMTSVPYV